MTNEIKPWIIKVSYGYNCSNYYGAYSVNNPLDSEDFPDDFYTIATEELWDDYSYVVTGWDDSNMENDKDEDPEAYEEEYDQLKEDFISDVGFEADIDEYNEINKVKIVYDERKKSNYIITDFFDWDDEFDVYFLEILDQDEYDKYNFAQKTLKEFYSSYWFGTNEGWYGNFDYLQFRPKKITDEEIEVLNKFHISGLTIYEDFINSLDEDVWNIIDDEDPKNLDSLEFDEFCRIINKYKSIINE